MGWWAVGGAWLGGDPALAVRGPPSCRRGRAVPVGASADLAGALPPLAHPDRLPRSLPRPHAAQDPVVLPDSRVCLDRPTIERHLLSSATDPFRWGAAPSCRAWAVFVVGGLWADHGWTMLAG